MRVLIISQYYPPENVHLVPSLAKGLALRGHDVRVLTGYPNYPEGRLFPGYKQRWRTYEDRDGISVLRVPLWTDHSRRPARRALNYVSFGASAAAARSFAKGVDVVYVYATQMTPALGPWLWRIMGGAPYVLHVQDLWPDSIVGSSMVTSGLASRAINLLMTPWLRDVYRRAGAVIGIAPTMASVLVARGARPEATHLVFNWAEERYLPTESTSSLSEASSGGIHVLYAGNVGDMQDLDTAVVAAHGARDAGVRLTIMGAGVALPRIRALVAELGSTNITFREPVPRQDIGAAYDNADFALVSLKDLPAFRGTVPSKLQAALSHGVPVISTVGGDVRHLIETRRIGLACDAENPSALEQALRQAAEIEVAARGEMAERARRVYQEEFSVARGIAGIEMILEDVVEVGRKPASALKAPVEDD